jgi:PPIC-type PPIASE domain/SurA N-terminal domain
MRIRFSAVILLLSMMSANAGAQVASHAPTLTPDSGGELPPAQMAAVVVNDKPVVRVNDAVLTNRDLVREMYAIFPYGQQHNGFPKGLEPQIRKGALDMIIFEELAYQEAVRRQMVVSPERMKRAETQFKKQFPSQALFNSYIKFECKGSLQVFREKIRRSLLIEALLKAELQNKATVSVAQAKAYYDKNPNEYRHGETVSIQTISIIPPANASPEIQQEARKRAEEALRLAKAAKDYREFGLLAEKMSDDDWHVNMGDRKATDISMLPPPIVEAARKMKPGEVSGLLQFGSNYTMFRLNEHKAAGRVPFENIRKELQDSLQKSRYNEARAALGQRLRKNAKITIL